MRANLQGADLGGAKLVGANLGGANLSRVGLDQANLQGADLAGANLSGANLSGVIGLDVENEKVKHRDIAGRVRIAAKGEVEDRASALSIRITEEPLTAENFSTIISVLTELYTKAWLIQQSRFPDLINYAQTHDRRFTKEANLVIGKLAHDSPTLIELLLNPATLAATATVALALKTAIDAVAQTRLRFRAMELDNQKKALEMKVREEEAQQAQQIALQKAQLEIAQQQLEIERKQLELVETKGILVQALLPNLLQLGHAEGLELALPEPQKGEDDTAKT